MTTADAFLQAIIAEPGDDALRLIFADWLDEHGQPERAEFIRVQIECTHIEEVLCHQPEAKLGDCCNDSLCPKCGRDEYLRRREQELLEAHWLEWQRSELFEAIAPGFGTSFCSAVFKRGFVAEITCTLADWCGTECGRCEGTALIYSPRLDDRRRTRGGRPVMECPHCHGIGRIGAHGPDLVQVAPLERVTLTDQQPLAADQLWLWQPEDGRSARWRLPEELFIRLSPAGRQGSGRFQFWYTSQTVALDALSAAALSWAKQVAQADHATSNRPWPRSFAVANPAARR